MFTNNWVNGTLYAYPIQANTYFDKYNKPKPSQFCTDLIYFDDKTNNFYYRSSPYYNGFTGKPATGDGHVNDRNLLYPTTIINLGMKSFFYSEISMDVSTKSYIIPSIDSTSYSDTSDLLNLFVITRITDEGFLQQLFAPLTRNNSLNQLFSRSEKRIDGDLAQLLSINSEVGVIKFSPEFYTSSGLPGDPVVVYGSLSSPTLGVFFSSTTENLQTKDFITPGIIDFRPTNVANAVTNAITYPFGIKSQEVPFYQWGLGNGDIIFGDESNNWKTSTSDIFSFKYQSLDRRKLNQPTYFIGSNTSISDTYARGYIFSVDNLGNLSINNGGGNYPNKFLVGAPNHFYFGLINGATALDKFKSKYLSVE